MSPGMGRMPEPGDAAPPLALPGDDGTTVSLAKLRGRTVVVYFYPKDDTSGCTVEACEFRDAWAELTERGVVVLGVSPDPVASHVKFRDKHRLPFPLLADDGHAAAEAWGVWGEKSMYGRKYMGILRTTFLVGADGRIRHVFRKVRPRGHAAQVLAALEE